jgi:P27 family predicted phage terminase small subunit
MTAGRPPVPAERKRRLGNPGKRTLPAPETVVDVSPVAVAPPAHLGEAGAALWRHVTSAAVWLAETDRPTLALLCEKVDRREDFRERLDRDEPVLYTDKGYAYANPLVGMLSTIETEIAKLFGAIGLTPTDRTRMGLAEVKAKNAFEEMMAKRRERE